MEIEKRVRKAICRIQAEPCKSRWESQMLELLGLRKGLFLFFFRIDSPISPLTSSPLLFVWEGLVYFPFKIVYFRPLFVNAYLQRSSLILVPLFKLFAASCSAYSSTVQLPMCIWDRYSWVVHFEQIIRGRRAAGHKVLFSTKAERTTFSYRSRIGTWL